MNRHIYTLTRPASWYGEMWREALPLGNGLTGVLIPGAIAEERIHFNRHDLWHNGNPGGDIPDISSVFNEMRSQIANGNYAAANQENLGTALRKHGYSSSVEVPYPLGWLTMSFTPESVFRHYRRGVNMRTGEAFVEFTLNGCVFRRQAFVSRADDITVLRMSAEQPFTVIYDFDLFNEIGERKTSERSIQRFAKNGDTAANVVFLGDITSEIQKDGLAVTGKDYTILVRCSSHNSPLDLDNFLNESYASLLKKHTDLYTPLYDALSIELSDDNDHLLSNEQMLEDAYNDQASPALMERLWRFGRYLFISAASSEGTPIPLYGLWHGGDNLQWSQFTANENVEMTYWHALAGGLSYAIPPLIRYYTSKVEKFRECAQKIFGMNGIWVSAYTSPNVASPCVAVGVIINWISCAGWLCRHFWDYYLYSGDEELLRKEILPFMYETALFYRDYAVWDGSALHLYPSVSPENTPGNLTHLAVTTWSGHPCPAVENATMDFAIMKELLTNLLNGMNRTGMYHKEADSFRDLLDKIPEYQINEDGAVREWMHDRLDDNYHHRHLSHLYPVFPGNEVTSHNNPVLFEAFRRAVELRKLGSQSGWSLTHMANLYARFGEAEKVAECLDIMAKSVVCNSLLTVHNDWRNMGMTVTWKEAPIQLDAAFGAVNAIQEMLFSWQEDALSILPALPKRLTSGTVRGMEFPGGKIDIHWEKSGYVTVVVYAERNLDLSVLLNNIFREKLILSSGQNKSMEFQY